MQSTISRLSKNDYNGNLTLKQIFKPIRVNAEDAKAYGHEPVWEKQPSVDERRLAIAHGFNWYSYNCDKKQAKKWAVEWLEINKKSLAKQYSAIKDSWVPTVTGWLARMSFAGLVLDEKETATIIQYIEKAIESDKHYAEKNSSDEGKEKVNKPNIQEIMIERAHEAGGDIEGVWDDYLNGDIRANEKPKIQQFLAERNVLAQHVSILKDHWSKQQKELQESITDVDPLLSEGYSCYTKTQRRL